MNTASAAMTRRAWLIYLAAAVSFLPTLWFYLVGEEGILVNASLEMAQHNEWLRLRLYGSDAQHGVFANWLIMLVCGAIGWEHAPGAVRAIMIAATLLTGLLLAFLVQRLFRDALLAALTAAAYVTLGDILFYRGWLGYRDPLLGLLVFGAIGALWLAVHERKYIWLAGVWLLASCAFLTKGIIAYAYIGVTALVLLAQREGRGFLLRPLPIVVALITLAVAPLWSQWVGGDQTHTVRLADEIGDKLMPLGLLAYLEKLALFPVEILLRLVPLSLLVLWWLWRRRMAWGWLAEPVTRTAVMISGVVFAAFWLAPQSHFRYLLPVAPLLALVLAAAVWRMGVDGQRTALRWMVAVIALKLVAAAILFPVYQHKVRGENYAQAASIIAQRVADAPLYTNDVTAAGLAVTAYLNIARLPRPVLTYAPAQWDHGYVLYFAPDEKLGKVAMSIPLGGDTLYVLCRGMACEDPMRRK
jgi:4-amino-4-deoxy-L-arabinose transferase-like glycosyltransferase